jgi:alpha-tubulin suppressor-like RCC1 family protein
VSSRAETRGDFRSVAAGGNHTCAVRKNGQVQCLGDNTDGQHGEGLTNFIASPVAVKGI